MAPRSFRCNAGVVVAWVIAVVLAQNLSGGGSVWKRRQPEANGAGPAALLAGRCSAPCGGHRACRGAARSSSTSAPHAEGRIHLVTGATDGIGKFTAELLAKCGDTVVVHGRSAAKVQSAIKELQRRTGSDKLFGVVADLSLMADVRKLAAEVQREFPRLDGLLNNAGTFDGDYSGKRVVTKEGNEYSLAVNVMAPFLLSSLLLENVKASGAGRIIITSSMSAGCSGSLSDLQLEKGYSAHTAYSLSKLCDQMMAVEMDRRYGDPPRLCFHTLDPDPTSSWINTKMLRAGWSGGGHPVTRATASFRMLTEDRYGQESGFCWGVGRGAGRQQQADLWDDLVALTGASWPVPA